VNLECEINKKIVEDTLKDVVRTNQFSFNQRKQLPKVHKPFFLAGVYW